MNELGIIRKFNGIHADQTSEYTHLHCTRYIDHLINHHGWKNDYIKDHPTPMRSDPKYQNELQETEGPTDPTEARKLQTKMGFNYRQLIGKLIYAYTTCRVDIAAAIITLS